MLSLEKTKFLQFDGTETAQLAAAAKSQDTAGFAILSLRRSPIIPCLFASRRLTSCQFIIVIRSEVNGVDGCEAEEECGDSELHGLYWFRQAMRK